MAHVVGSALVISILGACEPNDTQSFGFDAAQRQGGSEATGGQSGVQGGTISSGGTGGALAITGGVPGIVDAAVLEGGSGGSMTDSAAVDYPSTGGQPEADSGAGGKPTSDARADGGPATGGVMSTVPVTLFLASDSTVRYYPKSNTLQQGWGQRLAEFLTENVKIENRALGGRAIVQFYNESRSFPQIMKDIKPGDYVFIAFGINDRGDVPDQNVFREYLQKYITETRAKQGIPVIVTPTPRQQHENGVFTNAFTKYCESDFVVGEATKTPVIDLQSKALKFFTELGPEKVKSEMMVDALHYKQMGAYHMARLIAEGLTETTLPLAQHVIKANLDPARAPIKDGW